MGRYFGWDSSIFVGRQTQNKNKSRSTLRIATQGNRGMMTFERYNINHSLYPLTCFNDFSILHNQEPIKKKIGLTYFVIIRIFTQSYNQNILNIS